MHCQVCWDLHARLAAGCYHPCQMAPGTTADGTPHGATLAAQDMERQALNVFRMRLLGAEVRAVNAGTCTLKDATSEAIRDWVSNVETTHYILGSTAGPHPYPMMVSTAC